MNEKLQPLTINLSEPIKWGDKTYSSVTFTRKMKGKDMLAMDSVKGEIHQQYALLASLLDVPIPVISEIDVDDLTSIMEAMAPFLGKFTATATSKQMTDGKQEVSST